VASLTIQKLERIASQYKNEDEIKIMSDSGQNQGTGQSTDMSSQEPDSDKTASDASDASHYKNPYGVFNENNKSTVHESTEDYLNTSSESSTEYHVNNINKDSNCTLSNKSNNDIVTETTNTLSTIKSFNNTSVKNNDNSVHILSNSSTENNYNHNNPLLKSDLPVLYMNSTSTNQIKLYSNNPYTPYKSDASDASDAPGPIKPSENQKTKAEQVGLPELPCIYCAFKDPIELDLSIHYVAKHKQDLIRLPIGKSSIDARADYAVELSKKKLVDSFDDDDDDRDDDEDENESDE
jgi:hypothetical protein